MDLCHVRRKVDMTFRRTEPFAVRVTLVLLYMLPPLLQ